MGLKENVIIGKLIPAGSGLMSRRTLIAARAQEEPLLPEMGGGGVAVLEAGDALDDLDDDDDDEDTEDLLGGEIIVDGLDDSFGFVGEEGDEEE